MPIAMAPSSEVPSPETKAKPVEYPQVCPLCKVTCYDEKERQRHRSGLIHRYKYLTHWYGKSRTSLLTNKSDVVVVVDDMPEEVSEAEEGRLEIAMIPGHGGDLTLVVYNGNENPIRLRTVEWLMKCPEVDIVAHDKHGVCKDKKCVLMPPQSEFEINLKFTGTSEGAFTAVMVFQFRFEDSTDMFFIVRELVFHVQEDLDLMKFLLPKGPYKAGFKGPRKQEDLDIVSAPPIEFNGSMNELSQTRLGQYHLPEEYNRFVAAGMKAHSRMASADTIQVNKIIELLAKGVRRDSYAEYFSTLLYIEEAKMKQDMRLYDMHKVPLGRVPCSDLMILKVPGLAEKRPSVLKGDSVFARLWINDELGSTEYEGRVEAIGQSDVRLQFDNLFYLRYEDRNVSVRFSFTRRPIRYQHRALEVAQKGRKLSEVLFPRVKSLGKVPLWRSLKEELNPFNNHLKENREQWQAVRHIVSGSSRPVAYLVFGPPGTGKTVTLVEAIIQVWNCLRYSHILVCGASNSASDLLAKRLLTVVPPEQLFRMHAVSRDWKTVPKELKECSNWNEQEKSYFYPAEKALMQYRIVVATLVTAGRLVGINLPKGHFTHVFVDEGGQAMEPEMLVAVAGILDANGKRPGQLVVGGDPKQLGPVLQSGYAMENGLGMSFLERMMTSCDIYHRHGDQYDPRVLTKLLKNFRSHEHILKLPSSMFYDDELQACGDTKITESLSQWSKLPRKGFPVVFHGVLGRDLREENSPSFYNAEEVMLVIHYIKELLEEKSFSPRVTPDEIGVISPYRKQVQKIQKCVGQNQWDGMTVGSTEEFQGQERRVIIISTVRSSPSWLNMDQKHMLGFLCNPKRFNVAITRAQALLIVIGNPNILKEDDNWNKLLQYCLKNESYVGPPFEAPSHEGQLGEAGDFLRSFNDLKLGPPKRGKK